MFIITEIKDNKVLASWEVSTLEDAIDQVNSLKISGVGKTYSIENKDGTVVEVIKIHFSKWENGQCIYFE